MSRRRSGEYDWDVVVVGGGPAGLSAAVRTRWIKRYKAVPCSTLVLESASPGGLATWKGCLFAGPSWKVDRTEIMERFSADIDQLNIPIQRAAVTRIEGGQAIKKVVTRDGTVYRCLAVVVAAGIKRLVNEKEYLGKGLMVTSMGYEFIVSMIGQLFRENRGKKIVVVGGPKLTNLMPLVRELAPTGQSPTFLMEDCAERLPEGETRDMIAGRVEEYLGEGRLTGVKIRTHAGIRRIDCDLALLDFNSYELAPGHGIIIDGADSGSFTGSFVRVDADMQTDTPGILAAGDVTMGGYNSFSRAVSQGITAGLSAYRYVYSYKFGQEPPLFAYRATDFVIGADYKELPELQPGMVPVLLARTEVLLKCLEGKWRWLADRMDGARDIGRIAEEQGVAVEKLTRVLAQLVAEKMITVHVRQPQ